jgi:carbonic anhydrase
MSFCTAVNCIDGRVQLPVIEFLRQRFGADYVDSVTEAAPVRILAGLTNRRQVQSIIDRIEISINSHKSKGIAVVAHHDCAGNDADKQKQLEHLDISVKFIKTQYQAIEAIGLWVDENRIVTEIQSDAA